MQSAYFSTIILLLISNILFAQAVKPLKAKDYLGMLGNSKDSLYQQIMVDFERYLEQNPEDVEVRLEKCKLIGEAFYDGYDGYNPLQKDYNSCVKELIADFPTNKTVLLYQLENSWGDSAITVANKILKVKNSAPDNWTDQELSIAYQKLANTYVYYGTTEQVINSAESAQALNDTLDLSYLLAQQYEQKNLYSKAIELLLSRIDSTNDTQLSYNKAILLLELGEDKKALELFQIVQKDTSLYIDNGKIAQALIVNEQFEEAREYLLKDLSAAYEKSLVLHNLFEFDYQHSPTDTIFATYSQLMEEDFHNDTFGKYRFMLMLKAPFRGWEWNDSIKLISFISLITFLFILPYIYVLPIDFISRRFGLSKTHTALQASTWCLKDFWLISSLMLTIDVMAMMIFYYEDLLSMFFNELYIEEESKISLSQANQAIVFFVMMLLMTIFYLKKIDYRVLKSTNWTIGKSIGLGILLSFFFRMIYFALARYGVLPGIETSMLSSVMDYLKSINQYYHPLLAFLFAVIIVPFYEEFIFRGIMLNSIDRRIKFIAANIIQSLIFALVHDNMSLFLFYFLIGIITGAMVKKSNSLIPALSFHVTNNFFAFIVIMRM